MYGGTKNVVTKRGSSAFVWMKHITGSLGRRRRSQARWTPEGREETEETIDDEEVVDFEEDVDDDFLEAEEDVPHFCVMHRRHCGAGSHDAAPPPGQRTTKFSSHTGSSSFGQMASVLAHVGSF